VTIELPAPAISTASSSSSAVSSGAASREREVEVDVVLDIAHNEDAMIALVSKVQSLYPNRITRYDQYALLRLLSSSRRCSAVVACVGH
jgi:folylpolyglutamate synthase/dihydropteroate synthase